MLNGNVSTKSTDMGFYIFQLGGYYNKMCCPAVCISSNMGGGASMGLLRGPALPLTLSGYAVYVLNYHSHHHFVVNRRSL